MYRKTNQQVKGGAAVRIFTGWTVSFLFKGEASLLTVSSSSALDRKREQSSFPFAPCILLDLFGQPLGRDAVAVLT